jgi:hypothetical protein
MDIVVWLRSLGLGKYEAVFRENEIDETVLAKPDCGKAERNRRRSCWSTAGIPASH